MAATNLGDSPWSSGVSTPLNSESGTTTPLRSKANKNSAKGKEGSKKEPVRKKEVRILMLHGYTQSGELFRAKTRALEKLLVKALSPFNLLPVLVYPTAPNRLRPSDIPGFQPASASDEGGEGSAAASEEADSWAWFRKDEANGNYKFLKEGMHSLARDIGAALSPPPPVSEDGVAADAALNDDALKARREKLAEDQVIDGVIGFSQGGCMAAMLASAMETGRAVGEEEAVVAEHRDWVDAVRQANKYKSLKFAVSYSGFYAVPQDLEWLYSPKVKTRTLHFLGSLDTVVEESRSMGLVERCEDPVVMVHPGGHYVPISKEWVMPLVGFVRDCLAASGDSKSSSP